MTHRGKSVATREGPQEALEVESPSLRTMPNDEQTALVPFTPDKMIQLAIEQGNRITDVAAVIEKLTRLKMEQQEREDRREMARAIAKFQSECPSVPKSSTANITSGKGAFKYSYADLEQIAETVAGALRVNGLSYSWDSEFEPTGAMVKTTCILRHENGQSIASTFTCPTSTSAGMSDQQRFASAQMFGRRKSLEQVLGLVAVDMPDRVANEVDPAPVTEDQAATLQSLLEEVGADKARFLAWLAVPSLADLPAARYDQAVAALEAKRRRPR